MLGILIYTSRIPHQLIHSLIWPVFRIKEGGEAMVGRSLHGCILSVCAIFAAAMPDAIASSVINFEGFPDLTQITNQYSGLLFSNATIITSFGSLNDAEFPPHSGVAVAFNAGGSMLIDFATPALSVSGFFTYSAPLVFDAFNLSNKLVASASSAFSSNLALSGDAGSSPNEQLTVSSGDGIARVIITGDPGGGSFVIDDLTYQPTQTQVPEPSLTMLSGLVVAGILMASRARRELRG